MTKKNSLHPEADADLEDDWFDGKGGGKKKGAAARERDKSMAPPAKKSIAPAGRKSVAPPEKKSIAPQARKSIAPAARKSIAPQARKSIAPAAKKSIAPGAKKSIAPGEGSIAPGAIRRVTMEVDMTWLEDGQAPTEGEPAPKRKRAVPPPLPPSELARAKKKVPPPLPREEVEKYATRRNTRPPKA